MEVIKYTCVCVHILDKNVEKWSSCFVLILVQEAVITILPLKYEEFRMSVHVLLMKLKQYSPYRGLHVTCRDYMVDNEPDRWPPTLCLFFSQSFSVLQH